ncbi:MAG TPA: SDR family NAD(P)-dependent oxidoreductase [Actinocrinis sp.]
MQTPTSPPTALSRAMETIKKLRQELDERSGRTPIAVVGIGLRLPGGISDAEGYWRALRSGADLVGEMPAHRQEPFADQWRTLPRRGGFLDEVLGFDAEFFGISPREARAMDPQHRLLLEVASESLHDAAVPTDALAGNRVGLYVGVTGQDYRDWQPFEPDVYWATGNGNCFAAGRISYALGLNGPSVAVDTACSSSLVGVHLAANALRRGECELALAGGVNLVLSPRSTRLVVQTRSLSPDGLCRAFDARANGFVRGEGCGIVVLKRLDAAVRDGDRIHAVIQGSALNQDGRSSGFTAPNVLSQTALIRSALEDAGLSPADIGLIEAHGTGTALGDPIEMAGIVEALCGPESGAAPLYIGSAKTNLGHLEAAAGIAGLVKAILAIQHREVPPIVHLGTPNPRLDIDGTRVALPTQVEAWAAAGAGGYAGVSSFGMSGTNAHIVLGPAPAPQANQDAPSAPVEGFTLTARSEEAVRELAASHAAVLERLPEGDFAAFAYSATHGRARQPWRIAVRASDPAAAAAALLAFAAGQSPDEAALTGPEDRSGADRDAETAPLPRKVLSLPNYPWQRRRMAPDVVPQNTVSDAGVSDSGAAEAAAEAPQPAADEPVELYLPRWEFLPAAPAEAADDRLVIAGGDAQTVSLLADAAATLGRKAAVLAGDKLPGTVEQWRDFARTLPAVGSIKILLAPAASALPTALPAGDLADDEQPAALGARLCDSVVSALRGIEEGRSADAIVTVSVVTRGAVEVTGDEPLAATDHGLLHGLAPVLGLEFADSFGRIIDLPAEPRDFDAAALLAADGGAPIAEDVIAIRAGVPVVMRIAAAEKYAPKLTVRADGAYVVTGGLGGVGGRIASDLAARGAGALLLIGRRAESELSESSAALLEQLRATGSAVEYRSADADDPAALARAVELPAGWPEIRGIVHAGGTIAQVPLRESDAESFAAALRGKYSGGLWLHLLSRDWPLDFFIQTSSVSALWGAEGYGAYAAANGGLDALAGLRAGSGLPASSIAFGPWDLVGMTDAGDRANLERMGIKQVGPAAGCASLTDTAPDPGSRLIACSVAWDRLRAVMGTRRVRGLLGASQSTDTSADASAQQADTPAGSPASGGAAWAEISGLPGAKRKRALLAHVRTVVAGLLGHEDVSGIPADTGFFDLGLDSIVLVDLVQALSGSLGLELKIGDVFDHPTATSLTDHLLDRLEHGPAKAANSSGRTPHPGAAARPAERPGSDPRPVRSAGSASAHRPAPGAAEPIAIVGMAGRFPGADSVEGFWDLLDAGRDAVGPVPADRWDGAALHDPDPLRAGTTTTDQGGFLTDLDRFDASFFGIPAREATALDPQQRLLLESAWHALEDAAIDPASLKGTRTGVFVGITNSDYARLLEGDGLEGLDAYFGTGTALNVAAGRLAFVLGLNGPAMAIDTACSSSLVALHQAIRSLRLGETDASLVGGVNVLADPSCTVAVSRAHMLSPEGRCKTFSAQADGFVRAEGCGVVVLKRLVDAERDGDRVLAVILGSAVNSDGASSGLTVPSGAAQSAVISAALADAAVSGKDIDYLEAHGTGTSLGDPIEIDAAWSVLGSGRDSGTPLHVGSVKSNIGHSESASGMAALFKTVLALRNQRIPSTLHAAELNPHIPWDRLGVNVAREAVEWPAGGRPRLASISGFGFSGTNAHLVLREAAPVDQSTDTVAIEPEPRLQLVTLSAPDADGLSRVVEAWAGFAEALPEAALPAAARASGTGRAHLGHRTAVVAANGADLAKALRAAPGRPEPAGGAPRVAYLFSGQGSQYFGMGRELFETEPVFADTIRACDEELAPLLGASIAELMYYSDDTAAIDETRITQPALVCTQLALAALWDSWGLQPEALIGHSVGEITAAIYAGVISRRDGLRLIAERARLMQTTEPGGMLAVQAPEESVREWIEGTDLDIAAVNGPTSLVLAGLRESLDAFAEQMKERGVPARKLAVLRAFHSRLMDPVLEPLSKVLEGVEFCAPNIPIVSNLTGRLAEDDQYGPAYWADHVRNAVRFHDGMASLIEHGVDLLLEIGPDRTLINMASSAKLAPPAGGIPSLRRTSPNRATMLAAAKTLYELGQDLDWAAVHGPGRSGSAAAPKYPFADTRYWTTAGGAGGARVARGSAAAGRGSAASARPAEKHWGRELHSPALTGRVISARRDVDFPAYLGDHRLYGTVVTPAASHLGTMLSAFAGDGSAFALEDMVCPRALVLLDGEEYQLQILDDADRIGVHSQVEGGAGEWTQHVSARRGAPGNAVVPAEVPNMAQFMASAERHIGGEDFYAYFRDLGYTLGPSFKWIADVWISGREALVRYAQPVLPDDPDEYRIYPGMIDSCFQSIAGFLVDDDAGEAPSLAIPFSIRRVDFPQAPDGRPELWGHVVVRNAADLPHGRLRVESADLHVFTAAGQSVMVADDFRVRHASRAVLQASLQTGVANTYALRWEPAGRTAPAEQTTGSVVLVGEGATASAFTAAWRALGWTGRKITAKKLGAASVGDSSAVVDVRPLSAESGDAVAAQKAAIDVADAVRRVPAATPYLVVGSGAVFGSVDGMLTALEAEQSGRRLVRLQLDSQAGQQDQAAAAAAALAGEIGAGLPESRLALADGEVRVRRMAPADRPESADTDWDGSVAITGGCGALGLSLAALLAEQGAGAVALMSRRAPEGETLAQIEALRGRGVRVEVVAGDVTSAEDCARLVATAQAAAPLRGVFHLAGTTADGAFDTLTAESFDTVFGAKCRGADTLVAALRDLPHGIEGLRALVFFSSVSATLGSAGQANYAAANGYLDGLAEKLRAEDVPAVSVSWGPWVPSSGAGLAATDAVAKAVGRLGLRPLTDETAAPALDLAVNGGPARLVAVDMDVAAYCQAVGAHPRAALVAGLLPASGGSQGTAEQGSGSARPLGWLRAQLDGADPQETLREAIRAVVAEALGESVEVDDHAGFSELGLDSIMVIDLRARLSRALDYDLPATVAIDHPTVAALARHIAETLEVAQRPAAPATPTEDRAPAATPVPEPARQSDDDPSDLSLEELLMTVQHDLSTGV